MPCAVVEDREQHAEVGSLLDGTQAMRPVASTFAHPATSPALLVS